MRINEIINETLEEALSRRDFLKGAGAAAGLGTLGVQTYNQTQRPHSDSESDIASNTPKRSTTAQNSQSVSATQPDQKPAPEQPENTIPKYSPAQLEQFLIDYVSKYLPVNQCIQFLAQAKTETDNFRSLSEYDSSKHSKYSGGAKYKGRGYLHLTHDYNYKKYGQMIGEDLINNPDLLLQPDIAAQVSLLYWKDYVWPTTGRISTKFKDRFKSLTKAVTRVVNGGYNKLEERQKNVIHYTNYFKRKQLSKEKSN